MPENDQVMPRPAIGRESAPLFTSYEYPALTGTAAMVWGTPSTGEVKARAMFCSFDGGATDRTVVLPSLTDIRRRGVVHLVHNRGTTNRITFSQGGVGTVVVLGPGETAWIGSSMSGLYKGGLLVSTAGLALLSLGVATAGTIAGGVLAATASHMSVDTEAAAASDDLNSITGYTEGAVMVVRPASGARTVVLKHGTGADGIYNPGGQNISLADAGDYAILMRGSTYWTVLSYACLAGASRLRMNAATQVTVAAGVATLTQAVHSIEGEGGAPDNLDTLAGIQAGEFYLLSAADAAHNITVRHGIGNITCPNGVDVVLDLTTDAVLVFSPDGVNAYVVAAKTTTSSTALWYSGSVTPAADDVAGVHAGFAGNDAALPFPGPFTDPDVARTVQITCGVGYDGGDVQVDGTDQFDAALSEVLTSPGAGGGTVSGSKAFKTITGASKAAVGANPATVSIGRHHGIAVTKAITAGPSLITCDDANEDAVWDRTYSTFKPTTLPNGAHVYRWAIIGG